MIDDFESYPEGVLDPSPYPIARYGSEGRVEIFTDIPGTGGNKCAWFGHGGLIEGSDVSVGHAWHQIPLPSEIPIGRTGTVRFRIYMSSYELDWHVTLSKVASGDEPDDTSIWSHSASVLRYNSAEPQDVDAHTGSYTPSNPTFLPELGTWYDYWITINNSYDENQGQTGSYSVYVQGPNDTEPKALTFGGNQALKLTIRNQEYSSIKTLVLVQTTLYGNGVWYIDDIYFAPCETLSCCGCPDEDTWCTSYLIEYQGNKAFIDTGDLLGWLYLPHGPSSQWVWAFSISSWIYFPNCPETTASWPISNWIWLAK